MILGWNIKTGSISSTWFNLPSKFDKNFGWSSNQSINNDGYFWHFNYGVHNMQYTTRISSNLSKEMAVFVWTGKFHIMDTLYIGYVNGFACFQRWLGYRYTFFSNIACCIFIMVQFVTVLATLRSSKIYKNNQTIVKINFWTFFLNIRLGWNLRRNVFGNFTNIDPCVVGIFDIDYCFRSRILHCFVKIKSK